MRRAPPSVRLAYACLALGMGSDVQALRDASGLPERTTRQAVRWLVAAGLARRVTPLKDARRSFVVPVLPLPVPVPAPPAPLPEVAA